MKTAFDKLSDEFDGMDEEPGVVCKITAREKTIEQFRLEIADAIYEKIKKETVNSVSFMNKADYFRAKLSEAKIESLHTALGIIIDISTIQVKE